MTHAIIRRLNFGQITALAAGSADFDFGIASAMWLSSLRVVVPVTILVTLAKSLNVI